MKTVIGVFDDREHVEKAIRELNNEGFEPSDLSIVMKDQREGREIAEESGAESMGSGAAAGATTGAVIGGFTGFLASTVFPGLGLFLIGGPLAAALGLTGIAASTVSGAATGAVAGGLLGALMNLGLSESDAKTYEKHVNEGAILLAVPSQDDEEPEIRTIFNDHMASDIKVVHSHEDIDAFETDYEDTSYTTNRPAYATVGTKGGRRKSIKSTQKTRKTAGSKSRERTRLEDMED